MLRRNEREIIGGRVVFRKRCELAPLKQTDRQVETGGAVLPLIIAVGKKLERVR